MQTYRYSKYLNFIHILGDLSTVNISFVIAYYLKFETVQGILQYPYLHLLIWYNVAWLSLTAFFKPHNISRASRIPDILRAYFTQIILHLFLVAIFFVVNKAYYYSREHMLFTYILLTSLLVMWKIAIIYLIRIYRKKGFNYRNVIIVGYGEVAQELKKFFRLHPEYGYRLLGFFDNKAKNEQILGTFDDIKQYIKENQVNEIYCCLPYVEYPVIKELVDLADDNLLKVKLLTDFRGFSYKTVEVEHYDHIPVLNVTSIPLDNWKNRAIKRAFDIVFSLFVIIFILSWLMPIIAILIKLDSKGPIFFKQKRTGKNNKTFWCYKFRSMYVNDDSDTKQATRKDARITRVGAFLRKTSLDELPQFFNVLIGDMSVVGPRPHMLKHTEEYSKVIEKFMARHLVKPGITGLAQAKGYRGETESLIKMKNRVKFDRFYIENWSIFLDIKIIFLTVDSMLRRNENAF
ncbi:MAG: undecaprenyl-phosphate glucose phosphotransferase [Cytophagales bacterium]|nr:undecaprenyl-phosphate glucose phosphotransferase [Cytophagales bacterium]MDW8383345.1 undecaprenyl-phosphate glucose phosphotransferase [Flammeovirgaceae bacterium]